MPHFGLFGHLATRFGASPENLATESLLFILESTAARRALLTFLAQAGDLRLEDRYRFRSQAAGDDDSIPDLVGIDGQGHQSLVIEAKFWAGLTARQPVQYLRRLPPQSPALLAFVAPSRRLGLLWAELRRRCAESGTTLSEMPGELADLKRAAVDGNHRLLLVSWRRLLGYLKQEVDGEGDEGTSSDIDQLAGLCERMDSEAYLPIPSEELTSGLGWRVIQYCQLVDELHSRLAADGLVGTSGRRATAGHAWYGRTGDVGSHVVMTAFSAHEWARTAETPLWMNVYGHGFSAPSEEVRERLLPLELEDPRRLFDVGNHLTVPLFVLPGAEHEDVLEDLHRQAVRVIRLLSGDDERPRLPD